MKKSKTHAIEDVRFDGASSTLTCACGHTVGPDSERGVYYGYQQHRRDLGLQLKSGSDMGVTGEGTTALRVKA